MLSLLNKENQTQNEEEDMDSYSSPSLPTPILWAVKKGSGCTILKAVQYAHFLTILASTGRKYLSELPAGVPTAS